MKRVEYTTSRVCIGGAIALVIAGVSVECKSSERSRDPDPSGETTDVESVRIEEDDREGSTETQVEESGVSRSPERVVLDGVVIDTATPRGEPTYELYERDLARKLGRQLVESGMFAAEPSQVPQGWVPRHGRVVVRVMYTITRPERRELGLWVGLEGAVVWRAGDDPAPAESLAVERRLSGWNARPRDAESRRGEVLAAHAAEVVEALGRGLITEETIRAGGQGALSDALASGDVGRVLWSLELIADRKEMALFDRVIAALASDEPLVRDRALTTLVALGDPRAVDVLAKRASFGDLAFLRQVVEAVIALGGDDAREYLEFVASGHPDDDIKARAREGLERLARRAER